MKAIVFSKDRPMQLDACLRSLAMHAAEPVPVKVVVKYTSARYRRAYDQVAAPAGWDVERVDESEYVDFEEAVRHHLVQHDLVDHVLLAVDDTIFLRRFSPATCAQALDEADDVIGLSLRLGRNTTYCYPMAREQALPDMSPSLGPPAINRLRAWRWVGADGDFGYPVEVSSSVYRTTDLLSILSGWRFRNPNELEAACANVAERSPVTRSVRPWLMAYETSVAFSCPCNRVQDAFLNRCGSQPARSAQALLEAWEHGWRINVEAFAGYVPRGAHEEAVLQLEKRPT